MGCAMAQAQQPIGRVALQDAMVTGTLEVNDGQVTLTGGASIVAKDHTAELALARGGLVAVCATSSLHVTSGASTGDKAPLLFALDRGAIELRTIVGVRDAVITPDLRLTARSPGRLDLRIRVTRNGDTCVESRGAAAPAVEVVEQFGDGLYQIAAGQHVLFEHGSVREVVDHESSPCGCPPTPVMSLAESGVTVAPGKAAQAGSQAAQKPEEHPFPAAQSQGLTPEAATGVPKVPQAPPGQVHAQVTATMAYKAEGDATDAGAARSNASAGSPGSAGSTGQSGGRSGGISKPNTGITPAAPLAGGAGQGAVAGSSGSSGSLAASGLSSGAVGSGSGVDGKATEAPVEVRAPAAPAPPGAKDLAHRIGRFFKHVFGGR